MTITHTNTETEIQLQIAIPLVETPPSDDDPLKRVIIGILRRGGNSFPAEACLGLNKTTIVWEIDDIGKYTVQIDTITIDNSEGLLSNEIDLIELWTNHGLNWLLG